MNTSQNALLLLAGLLAASPVFAQPVSKQLQNPTAADVEVVGHVVEPEQLDPTSERIAGLRLPDGFEINVFARDLINPRMIAVADDGTVYATRRTVGDVVMLRDADGDGQADEAPVVVASRPNMHGIAIDGQTMYLTKVHELYRTTIQSDGTLAPLERLIEDFPDLGQHPNPMVVVGPDGMLYMTMGSTCNACGEANPENATLLRVAPDGSSRTIFASGLRNTIGYGFEPETGELYGMDHGIDWLGDNEQHEELNHLVQGNAYGWPYIYADGQFNPQDDPPNGITHEAWAARSVEPVGLYTPHAAPMQLAFYTGDRFPSDYQGDAFIAMRGSWNRRPPSGYEIVRIRFEDGRPVGFEPFVQGFLVEEDDGWGHLGRLAGLAQAADGSLLFSDDTNGVIYRVAYTGTGMSGGNTSVPTNEGDANVRMMAGADPQPPASTPTELAAALLQTQSTLSVESSAFADSEPIPDTYAAEGQNISPPLRWGAGPAGTRSYVVMMEDPDVAEEPPFVHWLLYNIPANVTALDEAVPGTPRLKKPDGAMQGANDRGSIGYYGPRPPTEDPPHAYHFQVFALDTMLDVPFGASRAELLDALGGHVLAGGTLVGTYER